MATKSRGPSNARALYDSLPEANKAANRHLLDEESHPSPEALARLPEASAPAPPAPAKAGRAGRQPNKNEKRYASHWLRGLNAKYEGLSFKMANTHRFTPDYFVTVDRIVNSDHLVTFECHEVKGSYKLQSQRGARLAFDQCVKEFPHFKWVWATWNGSTYDIEVYEANQQDLQTSGPGAGAGG